MRGKRGNSVYYKLTNSNNKETQGERAYVGTVSNPKTVQQAMQRMKLAPAVNFYRAFKNEILDHSFEGVKYGGRSHSTFMKEALNLDAGWPYVGKGESHVFPGAYMMSRGSLNGIEFSFANNKTVLCESIALPDADSKFGEFSSSVIEYCPWIQNGDQLTFAFILGPAVGTFSFVQRCVLDVNSEKTMSEALGIIDIDQDGNLTVGDYLIWGAAIIVSRPSIAKTNGAVTWQRSTSFMQVNNKNNFALGYLSQNAYNLAVESYMDTTDRNLSSTWYLNQGKAAKASQSIPANPLVKAEMVTVQCKDEDSILYGKWLTAIVDPSDGIVKSIAGEGKSGYDMSAQGAHTTNCYYFAYDAGADTKPTDLTAATQQWRKEDYGSTGAQLVSMPAISLAEAQAIISENNLIITLQETEQPALVDSPNP